MEGSKGWSMDWGPVFATLPYSIPDLNETSIVLTIEQGKVKKSFV